MQAVASGPEPAVPARRAEGSRRPRPVSSYRKPVPTEAELELRDMRRSLILPASRGDSMGALGSAAAVVAPATRASSMKHPQAPGLRPPAQEAQMERAVQAPPSPVMLPQPMQTWWTALLQRIQELARALLAG